MLVRLILFFVLIAGGFLAYRYLRAKKLSGGSGGLDVFEIERLMKIAGGSERLKEAMTVRLHVVEAAPASEKKSVSAKVDGALRRLAHIEVLRERIRKALAASDKRALDKRVATLRAEAEAAEPGRVEGKLELARQVETQIEQLEQLYLRDDELDEVAHRLLAEMKNLHLALLNSSSAEASGHTGQVADALAQLEESAEGYRAQTQAEEEIDRLLKAEASQRRQVASGS